MGKHPRTRLKKTFRSRTAKLEIATELLEEPVGKSASMIEIDLLDLTTVREDGKETGVVVKVDPPSSACAREDGLDRRCEGPAPLDEEEKLVCVAAHVDKR